MGGEMQNDEKGGRRIRVAATQMACGSDVGENLQRADSLVRQAAGQGANVVLLQELFATPYFCKDQLEQHFALAETLEDSLPVAAMRKLARELGVVLPVSFFERRHNAYFNSLVVVDADGSVVTHYRKSHIPDGPGYQEKYYFSPGDSGFRVARTRYGNIGAAICWDQWFPETARILALKGAELLLFPTAIGSEPVSGIDSRGHWQRAMQGHAAANMMPVIASNRIGRETGETCTLEFYGSSFIADHTGKIVAQADADSQQVLVYEFDLEAIARERAAWGLFRDRRPGLYVDLLSYDGNESPGFTENGMKYDAGRN